MDESTVRANREAHYDMAKKAAEFNAKVVGYPIPEVPQLMSEDRATFRADFMQEELDEFRKANAEGDLDGAVDAIIDLMYVACGAMNEMGVVTQPCYDEVHKANMAKKRGGLSKRPGSKGFDAIKPEGWKAPSHADYLTITSEDVQTILAIRRGEAQIVAVPSRLQDVNMNSCGCGAEHPVEDAFQLPLFPEVSIGVDVVYMGGEQEHRINGRVAKVLELSSRQATIQFYDQGLPQKMDVTHREVRAATDEDRLGDPACWRTGGKDEGLGARVMVMGYARHGKDTVSELLQKMYGAKFTSSSWFCAERIAFPALKDKYGYADVQACYDDRSNHRAEWYDLITAFNTPDLTSLGRAIFEGHEVYCGIRNAREFHALRNAGVFDVAIWVDASERLDGHIEDKSSCTVEPWMADFVLDNNGSLEDLERNLGSLMGGLLKVGN